MIVKAIIKEEEERCQIALEVAGSSHVIGIKWLTIYRRRCFCGIAKGFCRNLKGSINKHSMNYAVAKLLYNSILKVCINNIIINKLKDIFNLYFKGILIKNNYII
jgi:hypothetical protein